MNKMVRAHYNYPVEKKHSPVSLIVKGTIISLAISLIATILLAVLTLATDSLQLENYMNWVIITVIVLSIFIGSTYATFKAKRMGLVIGIIIGILYVLLSVSLGMLLNGETIAGLILVNKLLAGVIAGALGGIVGVNL